MVYIGTSGYSYPDWRGIYYPAGLKSGDWLSFYAQEFNAVEINSTFYRIPTATSLVAMAHKVPAHFRFTLKVPQQLTHERRREPKLWQSFYDALTPLRNQGKLGCVLAQFPTSFVDSLANREFLQDVRAGLQDLPTVVEFRHASWAKPEVFHLLRALQLGFCWVDSPGVNRRDPRCAVLLPPVAVATSGIVYLRMHGRNQAQWWEHTHAYERYDYSYTEAELQEWVPRLQAEHLGSHTVFVFANNCYRSQSIDAARLLKTQLGIAPPAPAPRQLELL